MMTVKNHLAGNPSLKPQFFVTLKNHQGEDVLAVDPRSTRAMVALMDMNAVMGGAASHYGGPAAFSELMSGLHAFAFSQAVNQNMPWHELFNLINDAGHCENGLYALKANYGFADLNIEKLKGFRSIKSPLSGHGEAHLFPEGVLLSNGPLGSALPQAQGLAMGDALAERSRVTITAISDGACMEGEAKEALAAIPGLAQQGKLAPFVLIISDNNTKLSGRIDKDSFSMEPTFKSLSQLGWKVVMVEDGHDLQNCYSVIEASVKEVTQNPKQPIVIHARTIKGIGTKKTAESSSGGHGFPLKSPKELPEFINEIYEGHEVPSEFQSWIAEMIEQEAAQPKAAEPIFGPEEKIQVGVAKALIRARKNGFPVVSITSDLPGSTGVAAFRKEYPHYSFDVGIAESNMVSVATGFSLTGYVPVVDTFAQFGVTKGALPLTMASLSHAPMIGIFSHTGFQDAADGASHQALSYYSMLASIPDVELINLTSSEEAESLVYQAVEEWVNAKTQGHKVKSRIFFLGRENFPKTYKAGLEYKLGKSQILADSSDKFKNSVVLVGPGSMTYQTLLAARELEKSQVGAIVVNPSIMNQLDVETFKEALAKAQGKIVVVEDHQKNSGYAANLTLNLHEAGLKFQMKSLGVSGSFGQSAYLAQELYEKHGIDFKAATKAALELVK
jgi:transketolase